MEVTSNLAEASAAITADEMRMQLRHRAAWGAVVAGVAVALVVQLLLNILGIGVGASSLNASSIADNPTASGFSMTAGAWWILSGILASLIGGLAAGRLCGSTDRNTAGWHGLLSWCVTTLVVAYLVTSAVGGLVGGTVNALSGTIGAVGRGAASAVTGVAQTGDADALQARVREMVKPNDAQSVQDAVLAYIHARLSGNGAAEEAARDRAVTGLARTANVSPDEARARLDKMVEQARDTADKAARKAQAAAEAARQAAATAGIFGFAALVLGAVAGWFGGRFGVPRTDIPRSLAATRTR